MEITFTQDGLIGIAILFGVLLIFLLMVREIRLMKTNSRKLEIELERDKLSVLKMEQGSMRDPSLRLSPDQLGTLSEIEETNAMVESDIFMKQKMVEGRIRRLENTVKREKLDLMIEKIAEEEKKLV